jgi:hypothetical protein
LIPFQVEISTAITIVSIAAILAVYLLVLKRNGWIGKPSIEKIPMENTNEVKPEVKIPEPAPVAVETKVVIAKKETIETQAFIETAVAVPAVRLQENKKVKRKNRKKADEPEKDRPEGCNHYFGYLWSLPKGTATPDECYMCFKLIDCYKETNET